MKKKRIVLGEGLIDPGETAICLLDSDFRRIKFNYPNDLRVCGNYRLILEEIW